MTEVQVRDEEFHRLLGYPRGKAPAGRSAELAEWAREWYAEHGRPWTWWREAERLELRDGVASIEGVAFASAALSRSLRRAEAHGLVLAAVSAGPELEEEAQRLWRAERPDEYFFLEIYGSAVVERLIADVGEQLLDWAETRRLAVLPHYSPGYPQWDVLQQPRLLELLNADLPSPLEALESGMLRPKKSLLAVFGLTRNADARRLVRGASPCGNCSYSPCQYRRVEHREMEHHGR